MNPSATDPSATDPSASDPSVMDPSAMDPSAMDPSAAAERPPELPPPDPGGTPAPGHGNLMAKPSSPGEPDTNRPTAVPGAYDAEEAERARGRR